MLSSLRVFDDLESMSEAAASEVAELIEASTGPFSIALSGGSTPLRLYELLAAGSTSIDWEKVHIFWGDERFVPADSPESNFGNVRSALIEKIDIPDENIHRIPVDAATAVEAAEMYEKELREYFGIIENGYPTFDLILLGLGDDGHTASIFPGDPVIEEQERWAAAVKAGAGIEPSERITLTLPVLNAARNIFFLVSGESKADALHDILFMGRMAAEQYPGAMISPGGSLTWYVDSSAYGGDLDP